MKRSSQATVKAVKQSEKAALEAYEANERENAAMALELSQVRRERDLELLQEQEAVKRSNEEAVRSAKADQVEIERALRYNQKENENLRHELQVARDERDEALKRQKMEMRRETQKAVKAEKQTQLRKEMSFAANHRENAARSVQMKQVRDENDAIAAQNKVALRQARTEAQKADRKRLNDEDHLKEQLEKNRIDAEHASAQKKKQAHLDRMAKQEMRNAQIEAVITQKLVN